MKHQVNSFKYAVRGLFFTIKHESHMRFHLVASAYVLVFANFFNMTAERWAILLLLLAGVISAETFNTSLEQLCNLDIDSYHPLARIAKDVAAGAVLVFSIISIVVGIMFFWQPDVFVTIFEFFACNILAFILFIVSILVSAIFVALGPLGIQHLFYIHKKK